MKNKRKTIICITLTLLSIIFTVLVKTVDVKAIGENEVKVGFATLNLFVFNLIGVNKTWYYVTDWIGVIPILMAIVYAMIGLIQLIKRKSLVKVDKELILLGIFYVLLILIYMLFEIIVINYRPILMNGRLEASYPSSHTLMAVCICVSSIMVNKKIYHNKITQSLNVFSVIICILTVIGRILSGVHWFTDIIGGLLFSSSLLSIFQTAVQMIKNEH